MTLQAALVETALNFPDRPWIHCEGEVWSYADGDQITDRLARGLMRAGVTPGDRVALLFENSAELVFSYYACFKIGAIAVPLNVRFQPPELAYALGHCEARMLLGQTELCRPVIPLLPELPHLLAVHVAGGALDGADPFEALSEGEPGEPAGLPVVNEDQEAALLYTSGTTARPKGVIHTHAGLCQQAENFVDALGRDVFERAVISVPLYHASGFGAFMLPVAHAGGSIWIVRRFEPAAALRVIEASRATYGAGLPVQVNMLVNHPGASGFDLSSLKVFLCGGDYVPGELQSRFEALFGVALDEICAMTELFYAIQPLGRGERRPGSIGKPMGDVQIALVDDAGAAVRDGEVGEIICQSAAASPGYWNDPQSTAAAIREGWLYTGDLGRRDADGFYWFAGRSKDVIVRGGSNISPGEVEDVLYAHPAVSEVGVVGAPDPEFGQVVWAYVALQDGAQATQAELVAWARERIAVYKTPERIIFADRLPKGLTGKIHRKTLRDQAAAELKAASPAMT